MAHLGIATGIFIQSYLGTRSYDTTATNGELAVFISSGNSFSSLKTEKLATQFLNVDSVESL